MINNFSRYKCMFYFLFYLDNHIFLPSHQNHHLYRKIKVSNNSNRNTKNGVVKVLNITHIKINQNKSSKDHFYLINHSQFV